jgi:S-phase kinase-associated protein 1
MAADFLGIPDLVDLMATHIAEQMKDKSPEEIRQFYNITNDLTPEDIEQIDKENEWALSN